MPAKKKRESPLLPPTPAVSRSALLRGIPLAKIRAALRHAGIQTRRPLLPYELLVRLLIAVTLQHSAGSRSVLRWLLDGPSMALSWARNRVASRAAIAQSRAHLGDRPLRWLFEHLARPFASAGQPGACFRHWHLVAVDGTTLSVADTPANDPPFGRPGSRTGTAAFPKLRVVALLVCGTRVLFGGAMDAYCISEQALASRLFPLLRRGMLCLADRNFFSWRARQPARRRGADLLWRLKKDHLTHRRRVLEDGSYLTTAHPSPRDRRRGRRGVPVRVVEYSLPGVEATEPVCRLVTTILDLQAAPAHDLAVPCHECWETETAFSEVKVQLRQRHRYLRGQSPVTVRQEFCGLLLAHYVVRGVLNEAAAQAQTSLHRVIENEARPSAACCEDWTAPDGAGTTDRLNMRPIPILEYQSATSLGQLGGLGRRAAAVGAGAGMLRSHATPCIARCPAHR